MNGFAEVLQYMKTLRHTFQAVQGLAAIFGIFFHRFLSIASYLATSSPHMPVTGAVLFSLFLKLE